jgi:hypothetical protein
MRTAPLDRPTQPTQPTQPTLATATAQSMMKKQTRSQRKIAGLAGLLFIFCTITFVIGNALIKSYFSGHPLGDDTLVVGVLMEALTGFAGAGIGVAMCAIMRLHGPLLSTAYLVLRALECCALIAVGVYFVVSRTAWQDYDVFVYAFTGTAGLVLSFLLLRSRLVTQWLCILGIVGYAALLLGVAGSVLSITDIHSGAGVLFLAPGGLFELVLPLVLIFKGLKPAELPGRQLAQ